MWQNEGVCVLDKKNGGWMGGIVGEEGKVERVRRSDVKHEMGTGEGFARLMGLKGDRNGGMGLKKLIDMRSHGFKKRE
jgi:hypothetical protein